jgi:outer membrane protein
MKNLSLILNVVLLLAVAYLFFDRFSSKKSPADSSSEPATTTAPPLKVVYVNADTLLEHYTYFKQQKELLDKREKDADASLKARGRALEKEAYEMAKKAQTGTMTPKDLQEADRMLTQKQQNLLAEQDRITKDLVDAMQKLNDDLQAALREKLHGLKSDMGYDYILSYGEGSPVLMANDSLDITTRVLELLNQAPPSPPK